MKKGVGGILVSLILIAAIAAMMPMAAGLESFYISGYKYNVTDGTDEPLGGWTIKVTYYNPLHGYEQQNWTNTTNSDGYWVFGPFHYYGYYVVTEVLQPGWDQVYPVENNGTYPLDTRDDIPDEGSLIFKNQKLPPSGDDASIGDYVWEDLNVNGIQDAGEAGISNVTVNLYNNSGPTFWGTMPTNETGYYRFTNLVPGDYFLEFILPDGYSFSPPDQGDDDARDSDSNTTSGKTAVTTLESAEDDLTWDSGMYKTEPTNPGTGTPGYWKNHPEAWPVGEITIGDETYNVTEAIAIMNMSDGDKTYTMFRQLVAAKLNVLIGNDDSCIADTITAADAWMADHPVGSGVDGDDDAWENEGEALKDMLDDYNNGELYNDDGELCAPSRDVVESGTDTDTSETDTTEGTTIKENGKEKKKPKK